LKVIGKKLIAKNTKARLLEFLEFVELLECQVPKSIEQGAGTADQSSSSHES